MNNKNTIAVLCLAILVGIIFFSCLNYVSAEVQTLPTQKQNSCINLPQTCSSCTYVNLSSVKLPDSSMILINSAMQKNGAEFNYTFCNTTQLNEYIVTTCGDKDGTFQCSSYNFWVTPNGTLSTTSNGIFYIGVLVILIVFLVITLAKITSTDDYGWVVGYFAISYFLLLSILFMAYQIAINFLTLIPYVSTVLYIAFWITFILIFPLFFIGVIYLLSKVSSERDIDRMTEMGYSRDEAKKMKRRK